MSLLPRGSGVVPRTAIRRLAAEIVERFRPERVILFGSYARGKAYSGSDVDILVVMRTKNELSQAVRISSALTHSFPLDLIVRTPANLRWRIREGDWFLREVMASGKVLYDKAHGRMDTEGRGRSGGRRKVVSRKAAS